MRNLIKTTIFIFVFQICHTQIKEKYPVNILIENDTLVCFSKEQSKQIAVWNEQKKECFELRKNDSEKIVQLEKIATTQTGIIYNLENQVIQYKENLGDKDKLITISEYENKSLKKEVRKQKFGKWISIIGGVVLTTSTFFLLI